MSPGSRAFVALGSNLGDRRARLEAGLSAIAATPGTAVAAVSRAYENPAVGGPPQGDYWNAVAEVRTSLSPSDLLSRLHEIEDAEGRVRSTPDAPRTLDLDLLSHGPATEEGRPALPHPRAALRAFVVRPWREIAPEFVVPGTGLSVERLDANLFASSPEAYASLVPAGLLAVRRGPSSVSAPRPALLRDRAALAAFRRGARGTVGFVPTMGALHEGHATLVRRARAECDVVVASLFVNPTQFGPNEDFTRYPRTFDADLDLLARDGCDAVYAPAVEDLYPAGSSTTIDVAGVSEGFEGAARPGHFRGVATVVAKLLLRVRPDRTYFGAKDAQQVAVVRRLAGDLDLPGEIVVGPTLRDLDGLALSSRNRYLSAAERAVALAIPEALAAASEAAARGEGDAERWVAAARHVLDSAEGLALGYAAIVDAQSFERVDGVGGVGRVGDSSLLIVAAKVGATRLIDNERMVVGDAAPPAAVRAPRALKKAARS